MRDGLGVEGGLKGFSLHRGLLGGTKEGEDLSHPLREATCCPGSGRHSGAKHMSTHSSTLFCKQLTPLHLSFLSLTWAHS